MKKLFVILITVVSFCFMSCNPFAIFDDELDGYVESVRFQSENYMMMSGTIQICNIIVTPGDSFDYFDTEFYISNTDVAFIKSSTKKNCTIEARTKGSTIITAKVGDQDCQAVINVM